MAERSADACSVLHISESIDSMLKNEKLDEERIARLLEKLKSKEITLASLHQTGIGRNVNKLRKALNSEELIAQCKHLLKNWKKLLNVPQESAVKRKSEEEIGRPDRGSNMLQVSLSDYILQKLGADLEDNDHLAVRLKCREMLTKALGVEGDYDHLADIVVKIEKTIFEDMKRTTSSKYRSHVRSRVFNLKDSKNPTLRRRVKDGEIPPERFARMTADELASDEMKKTRQKMTKEAIDEHQMVLSGGTVTDLLRCGRCKKNDCTYTQVQTRSADEPMTTFALCNQCGHRWKFE